MRRGDKTKRCGGTDLSHRSFLWVGDKNDTATWALPVHDPTSAEKTKQLIQTSVYRFDEVKPRIPVKQHNRLLSQLAGAAQSYGISTQMPAPVTVTDDEMVMMLAERAASRVLRDIEAEYE